MNRLTYVLCTVKKREVSPCLALMYNLEVDCIVKARRVFLMIGRAGSRSALHDRRRICLSSAELLENDESDQDSFVAKLDLVEEKLAVRVCPKAGCSAARGCCAVLS